MRWWPIVAAKAGCRGGDLVVGGQFFPRAHESASASCSAFDTSRAFNLFSCFPAFMPSLSNDVEQDLARLPALRKRRTGFALCLTAGRPARRVLSSLPCPPPARITPVVPPVALGGLFGLIAAFAPGPRPGLWWLAGLPIRWVRLPFPAGGLSSSTGAPRPSSIRSIGSLRPVRSMSMPRRRRWLALRSRWLGCSSIPPFPLPTCGGCSVG